jgi:hypothetical protein
MIKMITELESIVKELKHYVKYYTDMYEKSDKSKYPIEHSMKGYYQGKLDAYSHALILNDILHKRMLLEDEEKVLHMANMYDMNKEDIK